MITESLCYGSQGKAPKYPIKPRTRMHASDQSLLKNFGMHGLIFFQRPMYWPKSAVGLCELEPKEKRCPRADRLAQRFRLLTEINNLRLIDNTINPPLERPLSSQERIYLLDQLQPRRKRPLISWRVGLASCLIHHQLRAFNSTCKKESVPPSRVWSRII